MIVISHPWEFVPKGSSHLNYHTNSSNTINNNNNNNNNNNCNNTGTTNLKSGPGIQEQTLTSLQQQQQQDKKALASKKNVRVMINSEFNNSIINDMSYGYLQKSPLINKLNFEQPTEKWHLKQINEYSENEIFIKDNKVIVSYGADNDSKVVKRSFTFDSPIFDSNWFNFKTDSNETGLIMDALCIFESQKLHVYFQNGSDYHIQLPFKLKNCWKLSDGILLERHVDQANSNSIFNSKINQPSLQILFTLSNPMDELKPVYCKSANSDGTYFLRDNSKQIIIEVIDSLNLILVFSLLNNVHYIYRIIEYISEDSEVVNNLLNATCQVQIIEEQSSQSQSEQQQQQQYQQPIKNTHLLSVATPMQSKKRLSVSPIITTHSFYSKLSINSPLVTNSASHFNPSNQSAAITSASQNINSSNSLGVANNNVPSTLVTAHHHFMQRNFSPMATLSRSPSCSSSPSVMAPSTVRRTLNANNIPTPAQPGRITSALATTTVASTTTSNSLQVINPMQMQFNTPLIEVNNNPYNVYKTPLPFYQQQQQQTPMNNYRRTFTPHSAISHTLNTNNNNNNNNNNNTTQILNMENSSEAIHEQMMPEYCLELIWTEPVIVAGDSSFNEKATKFFYITDLYNQKYICYLMPAKTQLRCLKIESNSNDQYQPVGSLNYIPARDAVFVESRNLMVIIDNMGSLVVYSGLSKLCKLQLHNIVWSLNPNASFIKQNKDLTQSPIITPIKSKLFNTSNTASNSFLFKHPAPPTVDSIVDESSDKPNSFKTPKQTNTLFSKAICGSAAANTTPSNCQLLLPQQQEYKSVRDSTGSRFSVKLSDNRLVRVNLNESSTCKLVSMCLEAFKYALNRDIYYEIIQQWYIHRYSAGDQSIRDQLNLFLYLILNLCGCFEMARLEQELPFLRSANTVNKTKQQLNETTPMISEQSETEDENQTDILIDSVDSVVLSHQAKSSTKRSKCNFNTNDTSDWEFLLSDISVSKNLPEFNFSQLLCELPNQLVSDKLKPITETIMPLSSDIPSEKYNAAGFRSKRSISLTGTSGARGTNQLTSGGSGGGFLFPYLKNILYVMHLIYEECKLYRSLEQYCRSLIQVQYLLAVELKLPLYMAYYESEHPFLLKIKLASPSSTSTSGLNPNTTTPSSSYLPKNSFNYLSSIMAQEPPVLHKFLLKLIEEPVSNSKLDATEVNSMENELSQLFSNPFPTISTVSIRTIKTIKIYALISLCTRQNLKNVNYNEFLNQLFFKINFSGFQQTNQLSQQLLQTPDKNQQTKSSNNQITIQNSTNYTTTSSVASNNLFNSNLKFNFKQGDQHIFENIFSLCLEMGLSTLNELYDYPFSILFPVLEAVHWSRENPCLSWPSYAFDLIGRNDLTILKINCDMLLANEQQQQTQQQLLNTEDETVDETNMKSPSKFGKSAVAGHQIKSVNVLEYGKKRPSSLRQSNSAYSNNGNSEDIDSENSLCLKVFQNTKKEEEDGMQHVMQLETLKCRFNEDLRIKEVRSCLQTTRPIMIKLTQGQDVSDHDFVEEEEKFLSCICLRTMSLPVARGMFTLHTINPIPTEPVIIPDLNLKGKSVTKKTAIDLTRVEVPANMTYWPLFHNGVAAGLTINSQAKDLSSAWIKSHLAKNFELTSEQAGFLYGLGLTGHLANLSILNVHDALTRRHDLTNIAIIIGLAASKIGSMDLSVTRLISMHVKALMPPVEIELEIPYSIQIASLLSLGLAYAKSANKHISYVLLKEIGRLPGNEIDKDVHSLDREAYSLTAGLSLGMILLEKGKKSLTIMDSTFTDELYHYMVGGHKEKYFDSANQAGYSGQFSNGFGSNFSNSGNNGQSGNGASGANTNNANSTEQNFPSAINSGNFRNAQSSYIREGESINTNVTCPGATLALGLIYFNSCDKLISEWFSPPDSAFLLDSIRPDFLLLRTVARNLIMWEYVLPTQKWLISQLSNILKTNLKSDAVLNKKFASLLASEAKPTTAPAKKTNIKATSSFKFKKFEKLKENIISEESDFDSDDEEEYNDDTDEDNNILIHTVKNKKPKETRKPKKRVVNPLSDLIQFDDVEDDDDFFLDEEGEYASVKSKKTAKLKENDLSSDASNSNDSNTMIDNETKTEAFRHIIAGACMSMGLKFAGSFNNQAYETLLFWARYFTDLNDTRLSTENCLCVIVLSAAMVMAGSGDLEIMRFCRYLRSRVGQNYSHVTYGSQMAINMALSLLFIGGGRYTLKTDSLSVALMLCAFYPHFPVDSNDNKFHLQAFRHLYVLASESRLLLSKDVDINEFCYVPIEITLKANQHHGQFKYQQMAPCILPELNRIKELQVLGPRYYPIKFKENIHFKDLRFILNSELFVKQKNGYFSYSDDPKDEKAFNIRNFLNKIIIPHKINPELLEEITNEEHVNFFAKMLNKSNENKLNGKTNRLLKIIYESVVQETFDFVGIMLLLDKETSNEPSSLFIQQMKLVDSFYKSLTTKTNHIISRDFLYSTINSLETKLKDKLKKNHELIKFYLSDTYVEGIENLIHYCIFNNISKFELQFFMSCKSMSDLLKIKQPGIQIEKLLKLYQLFRK